MMQVEEILIIKNGTESYGISTEDINQISRVPMLMPLPLRPRGVRGLCAVAGNIVSLLDFNLLLNMSEVDYDASKTRLVSLNDPYSSNSLLVSEVYDTVNIIQENIEYIENDNDPVIGVYKYDNMLIQVMSLEILVSRINRVKIEVDEVKNGKIIQELSKEEDSSRFLIFAIYKEHFALNIEYLQEIILVDQQLTEINGTAPEVLGLMTIREELLLVIDLRIYYGFKANHTDKDRILVASFDNKRVGLLVDEIVDIQNVPHSDVEEMKDSFKDNKIAGVIHTKDRLISYFDENVLQDIFSANDTFIDAKNVQKDEAIDYVMEVIVFKLLEKEYAFEVDSVDEIIDVMETTAIAFSEDSVAGIINIRGQIVTIVSLFEKLGVPTKINKDSKIIICNIDDNRIGFVVDSVSDILHIQESQLRQEDDEYFTNVLYLDDGERLVLQMDIHQIVVKKDV